MVGSRPAGASPCGALDMLGNAWEWTADWYAAYPGNPVPSIHYGEKYRVVKGSGAIDFYPPLNGKRLSIRGRIQPFDSGEAARVGIGQAVTRTPDFRSSETCPA